MPALSSPTESAARRRGLAVAVRQLASGSYYATLTAPGRSTPAGIGLALDRETALADALFAALPAAEREQEWRRRTERHLAAERRLGRIACADCHGDRRLTAWGQDGVERDATCGACDGRGFHDEADCFACGDALAAGSVACSCASLSFALCATCAYLTENHLASCPVVADAEALGCVFELLGLVPRCPDCGAPEVCVTCESCDARLCRECYVAPCASDGSPMVYQCADRRACDRRWSTARRAAAERELHATADSARTCGEGC